MFEYILNCNLFLSRKAEFLRHYSNLHVTDSSEFILVYGFSYYYHIMIILIISCHKTVFAA